MGVLLLFKNLLGRKKKVYNADFIGKKGGCKLK